MSHPVDHEEKPTGSAGPDIEVHAVEDPSVYKLRTGSDDAALAPVERAVLSMCRLILLATVGLDPSRPASPTRASSPAEAALIAADIEIQLDETLLALRELMRPSGPNQGTSFHFAHGVVFVSGRLLKAGRATYADVSRAGLVLDQCGIAEIALAKDVFTDDLKTLTTMLEEFHRSPEPVVPERITPRIRLRPVNDAARRHAIAGENGASGDEAIVHTYASAIVLMRRFYEGLRRGKYELPRRFRRIAQRLVDLSAGETPAFLGVTAARNANHDDAGRAVNTTVLSLAMARQITSDVLLLERIAMAALLYDTARPRLSGPAMLGGEGSASIFPDLSEDEDAEVPAATAVVLAGLGALTEASVVRTVLAYEANWVKRGGRLGPLYRGLRPPLLQARVIAAARAFHDLLTSSAGRDAMAADGAIATLEKEAADAADRTVLRLLIGALGIFPTGTLVELSTGEVALVIQTPEHPALYSQPRVRLVFDASGGAIDRLVEIDLAQAPAQGEPARHIRKVVATSDDASASAMRSFASLPGSGTGSSSSRHHMNSTPTGRSMERTPTRTGTKQATPPGRAKGSEPGSGEAPVSRARRAHTPPTVPTAPVSALGSHASPKSSAPISPRRQEASVPWPDEEGEGTGPITRELAWHNRAFMLLIEQVEAHRLLDHGAGSRRRTPRREGAPTPTAEGTLARTPLVHLLVYMLDRGLSGTTIFQTPGGLNHAIYFFDGAPAKVRTGSTVAPVDEVLLELGLLDEDVLLAALNEAQELRILLGRHLVAKGLIDRETMMAVLSMQLVRKLTALFAMEKETQYAYYDGVNLLEGYAGAELFSCEPLAMVMLGVRTSSQPELVNATLDRIGPRAIMIHPEGDVRRFRLMSEEARVVELIRKQRMTVADILRAQVASERVVRLTLYGLAITRHLDVGSAGRSPVGVVGGDSAVDIDPASIRGGAIFFREPPPPHASATSVQAAPASAEAPPRAPAPPPVAVRPAPPAVTSSAVGMFTPLAGAVEPSGAAVSPPPPGVLVAPPPPVSPARAVEGPGPRSAPTDAARGERSAPAAPPRPGQRKLSPVPSVPSSIGSSRDSSVPSSRAAGKDLKDANDIEAAPAREAEAPERFTPVFPLPPGDAAGASTVAERRAEIERRAASIDKESYFTVLGVAPDSSPAELQSAYFALAKKWHPDRLQGELADAKPLVARVFTRVTEAYRTLSDPAKRADYARMLEQPGVGPGGEQDVVARAVDAALEFQKAEVLLKKNDLAGAEALAKKAALADPDQADYVALLVWIQALRRGNPPPVREGRSTGFYDDLIKTLDGVITKEPQFERAIFYRATLLKRSGRIERALADFRQVVQLNPRNIDAAREVRLAGMRARAAAGPSAPDPSASKGAPRKGRPEDDTDPPEGGGGLFNKIFKR